MKVAVIGSRTFDDYQYIKSCLDVIIKPTDEIVTGGASGVDSAAMKYAKEKGLKLVIFYPDWSKGKGAGHIRNRLIAQYADNGVAFWDGVSSGTRNGIKLFHEYHKEIDVIYI